MVAYIHNMVSSMRCLYFLFLMVITVNSAFANDSVGQSHSAGTSSVKPPKNIEHAEFYDNEDQNINKTNIWELSPSWRVRLIPPTGNLIYYPDTNLSVTRVDSVNISSPVIRSFLMAWKNSSLGANIFTLDSANSNLVYLPTAIWPTEFIEDDFPDNAILPLPESVVTLESMSYDRITINTPWIKARFFMIKDKIIGAQIYHNISKLLSWQNDLYSYNFRNNVIQEDMLDIEFGSNHFFSSTPLKDFSRNAYSLAEQIYRKDLKHHGKKATLENVYAAIKEKNSADLELATYTILFSLSALESNQSNPLHTFQPITPCSINLENEELLYKAIVLAVDQGIKNRHSSKVINLKRKDIYNRINWKTNNDIAASPFLCLNHKPKEL